MLSSFSGSKPLVDKDRRIFATMIGRPNDPGWAVSCQRAFEAIQREGGAAAFTTQERDHRRGKFPAVNVGVTYGKGTTQPVNLKRGAHDEMLGRLLSNKDIARIAAFGSASFRTWAPRTYLYYKDRLDRLWDKMPNLERPFAKSIFPCTAINFGPYAWTRKHRDPLNCPFGWCLIHSLGPFDHKKGGHIVLHEAKLIVEFPTGCTIAIPSATITHSNIPVQAGDERASFTQFCSGGLFRYVDNGFRTEKEFETEDPEGYIRACGLKAERWRMGLELFSTVEELSVHAPNAT
ncbi:hypothetical protein FPV67DRAFT_1424580 [Lyophyllum atratum]|nr:hypothetical protein FPV67DRAFT_1426104 [Lyophyllum atratum]KAF8059875.1 hypothetical protein FPV67DRAFT_1424580 [Lyophyllum atratum]